MDIKMKYIGYLTADEITEITGKSVYRDFHFSEAARGDYVILPCDDEYIEDCKNTLMVIEAPDNGVRSVTSQYYYQSRIAKIQNDLKLISYIRDNFNITTYILVQMEEY